MAMDTHPDAASEPALETATALASAEAKSARSDLIEAAAVEAAGRGEPGGFVRDLFGRVPPEDLAPYHAGALAELARLARAHLAGPRRPGDPASLRLHDIVLARDGRERELTLVEAINDNRPFLLDSCLAELTGQGLVPLLVAHPILGVERDDGGALLRVVGETTAEAAGGLARESLIQIHLDRLEGEGQVAFRYAEPVNGSARDIAGLVNTTGNVLGMMPHPERRIEAAHGGDDGRRLFEGLLGAVA